MLELLQRLKTAAQMVIAGEAAADIGADHAQLSLYLIEAGLVPRVVIGELGEGPYNRACMAVQKNGLSDRIDVRQGDGLQILGNKEVATVILAGMGGDTIVEILAHDWDKAASFKRFIFQPMTKSEVVRQRLASRGWVIEEERLVVDKGRFYVLLSSRPGNCPYHLTPLETDIGPLLLKVKDQHTQAYLRRYLQKYKGICAELTVSYQPSNHLLAQSYREKIDRLEVLLNDS